MFDRVAKHSAATRQRSSLARLAQSALALTLTLTITPAFADTKKLSFEQKVELLRGLRAEFAIARVVLPRAKKPLPFSEDGTWNTKKWEEENYKLGPAARPGDMVQITNVDIDDDKITLEFNDGSQKDSFLSRIQIGMGNTTTPIQRPKSNAQEGTSIAIKFDRSIEGVDSDRVKKILSTVLDFDKHSATEQYVETLPEPIKVAIKEERAIEGMDREQVLMALGRPVRKTRETRDDTEYEDWVYGAPPGIITFVKFAGSKVVSVKEDYATMGGSTVTIPGPDQ